MTLSYVLLQNLRRNPVRTALTALAFALPMAVFVAAISLVVSLIQFSANAAKELRLAVNHKITITNFLPERMRKDIEALDPDNQRLRAICGVQWFGGTVENSKSVVQSLGADVDTFPIVFNELEMTPQEIEDWNRDRRAAVVGASLAEQYGWKLGDRIELRSSIPPNPALEMKIVKLITTPGRTNVLYFRRDYQVESLKAVGVERAACNVFWVKCNSQPALQSLQKDIDEFFANSPNATRSADENAFASQFIQASGDLPGLMRAMAMVVVFIVVLVAGNTMMMSFRERVRELAVFKAIGFQGERIFRIVLAESVFLALFGSLLGIVPISIGLQVIPLNKLGIPMLSTLAVSPIAIAISLVIATLVGLAAGLFPAWQAYRLNTVAALRRMA